MAWQANARRHANATAGRSRRAGVCACLAAGATALLLAMPAPAQTTILHCGHALADSHPLVTGFLRPWAKGVTVDTGGALEVRIVRADGGDAERDGLEACALRALRGIEADALALPFIVPSRSTKASPVAWDLLKERGRTGAGRLAVVLDGPGVIVGRAGTEAPALAWLDGLTIAAPDGPVATVLRDAARARLSPEATADAKLASLPSAGGAPWLLALDAGQSLTSRVLVLDVAPDVLAGLPATHAAALTQGAGAVLSAAGGRALDRAAAVTREAALAKGAYLALPEDRVGEMLDRAAALRAAWAIDLDQRALLDRIAALFGTGSY